MAVAAGTEASKSAGGAANARNRIGTRWATRTCELLRRQFFRLSSESLCQRFFSPFSKPYDFRWLLLRVDQYCRHAIALGAKRKALTEHIARLIVPIALLLLVAVNGANCVTVISGTQALPSPSAVPDPHPPTGGN